MVDFDCSRSILFCVIIGVVAVYGCVQSSSADLKSDFDLTHQDLDSDATGYELYQDSISQISTVSNYSVESDSSMAMNMPVISFSANMSSEGAFSQENYRINTSGNMNFNFAGRSNSTEFETSLVPSGNKTEIYRRIRNSSNSTEVSKIESKNTGISLEALKDVDIENASLIGSAQVNGENSTLIDLEVNSSSLVKNSEDIFEKLSLIQKSSEKGQGLSDLGGFNTSSAYLWINQDNKLPAKFAYYGSVNNGSLQVRSVTEYTR